MISLTHILSVAEIVHVIDMYIKDKDKMNVLMTNRSSLNIIGFLVKRIYSIDTICESWLYDSQTKIGVLIWSSRHNIPLKNNVYYVEYRPRFGGIRNGVITFYPVNIDAIYKNSGCTHIVRVKLNGNFNQKIERPMLDSITHLEFGPFFNQEIKKDFLPHNLTHLSLGMSFIKPIGNILPESLTHLDIDTAECWGSITYFPPKLTHLKFGKWFNDSLDNKIPNTVIYLAFGQEFSMSIDGKIPQSVKRLTLNKNYPHTLYIPSTIEQVYFVNGD